MDYCSCTRPKGECDYLRRTTFAHSIAWLLSFVWALTYGWLLHLHDFHRLLFLLLLVLICVLSVVSSSSSAPTKKLQKYTEGLRVQPTLLVIVGSDSYLLVEYDPRITEYPVHFYVWFTPLVGRGNKLLPCDITARTVLLNVLLCLTYMYCTVYILYILHTVHIWTLLA